MTKLWIVALVLVMFAFMGGTAYADTYNITTGSAHFQDIGNDGNFPGDFDQLDFASNSFTLTGGPVWAGQTIEFMTFTVGISCYSGPGCSNNTDGTAALSFIVNGNPFTVNVPWHVDISSSDTLTINSLKFLFDLPTGNDLLLITDKLVMGPDAPGTYHADLTGTFRAVPEPTSLLLFGSGLVGVAGVIRRRLLG